MHPEIIVPVAGIVMIIALSLGIPLVRAYAKRVERGAHLPALPSDLVARLERIEQGIEAMSMEVERISEGQRFTTKLLSDGRGTASSPPANAIAPAAAAASQQQHQQQNPDGTVLVESARRS